MSVYNVYCECEKRKPNQNHHYCECNRDAPNKDNHCKCCTKPTWEANSYCGCGKSKKKDNKGSKKEKDKKDLLVDFQSVSKKPQNVEDDEAANANEIPTTFYRPVASITFRALKPGDVVSLNGLIGIDSDTDARRTIDVRVFKGNPPNFNEGEEIFGYRLVLGDTESTVAPIAHPDYINHYERNVTYTVALQASGPDVFYSGPKTLTGMLIRGKK